MQTGKVTLDRDGEDHVAILTICNVRARNAITESMAREISMLCSEINRTVSIRTVVIRGEGQAAFCSGSDLKSATSVQQTWARRNRGDSGLDYIQAFLNVRKPLVAAIDGFAIGGGLEIALACDTRFATPDSVFSAAEILWGWHSGSGMTQLLPRLVGSGMASQMIFTGMKVTAGDAFRVRLVDELIPRAELYSRARTFAALMASRSPIAVQSAKQMIRLSSSISLEQGLAIENNSAAYCMMTNDSLEATNARFDHRAPIFREE